MKAFKITDQSGYSWIETGKTIEHWQSAHAQCNVEPIKLTVIGGRFVY